MTRPRGHAPHRQWLWALTLALLFVAWALRGLSGGGIVSSDAARHAMNGALVHDWLWNGPWGAPIEYARWYYSRTSAISLAYHPPLFAVLEAAAFSVLGVGPLAARILVALSAGVSVILMVRLVHRTHGLPAIALGAVALFFCLPFTQSMSQDIMLEFPALAFSLGALLALPRTGENYTTRRAIVFAVLAGAAVATKQLSVFLALVPILLAVFARRGSWLALPRFWLSSGFVVLVFALVELVPAYVLGTTAERIAPLAALPGILRRNVAYYIESLDASAALLALAMLASVALVKERQRAPSVDETFDADALYWAWVVAMTVVVLLGSWHSPRYLFPMLPAAATLATATVARLAARLAGRSAVVYAVALVVGAIGAWHLQRGPLQHDGPAKAAERIAPERPGRVIYAGNADGQFTFALRSIGGAVPLVIRGDKLPAATFAPRGFEGFARQYGVTHVVLEREDDEPAAWDHLIDEPSASMARMQVIPLRGIRTGTLHLYRFTNPSSTPDDRLEITSRKVGEVERTVVLDWSAPRWSPQASPR